MNELNFTISSEVGNIVKVENFIEGLNKEFQLPVELYGKVMLSVIEAVNNAILSGNHQSPDKNVFFEASIDEKSFRISVKDEGEGFDYTNIPDPTLPDNIGKDAGRGLYLMQSLTDELIFEENGAKVTLVFYL